MWDLKSPWSMADWGPVVQQNKTSCAPLCQHPPCWESNMKQLKGIPVDIPAPVIPPKEEIETDLPTLKICNMLDDYGEDQRDLYPVKYAGKPQHSRKSNILPSLKETRKSSLKIPSPPSQSPVSEKKAKSAPPQKPVHRVEVQEMFELEDLNSTWDDTFLPKKFYVWVPNPKRKTKQEKSESISQLAQGPKKILVRDMTEDMIPREIEYENMGKMRRRATSPVSSRYRTPYSRSSSMGLRPVPRLHGESGIDELLDLPRDILVRVLEHARQSDFASGQRLHELINKFIPNLDRESTNLTTTSADLLQQKKMNIYEGKERNHKESHLMETKPVYYLDEDGVEQEVFLAPGDSRGQRLNDSDYGSCRDLYMSGTREFPRLKKPLPPIGSEAVPKIPSISLGLPELPSGVRQTRTFNYSRRNYRNFDLTIGPVPTPPTSTRTEETTGSDHGTTVHVNIPSVGSHKDLGPPQSAPDRAEVANESRATTSKAESRDYSDVLASSKSERSAPRTPLHAVSPAQSTKVPQAPATTPATHVIASPMKLYRDQSGLSVSKPKSAPSQREVSRESTSSPTQDIRAPTNSPRAVTPEQTGLGTIAETEADGTIPVSRGGRSVRFAEEVPEVPPPPSSPQLQEETEDANIPKGMVSDKIDNSVSVPVSRQTGVTNQPTFNTLDKELSQEEINIRSAKKRDSSMMSTPEPWPQVNEADFDVTPANTKMALHDSRTTEDTKVNDSRLAHMDPYSDRSVGTGNSSLRADITSRDSTRSYLTHKEESPAPPPPSPEPKDLNKNAEESRASRKRDSKSRESTTMTPLMEENDEDNSSPDAHVRTLVIEVPPLGQVPEAKGPVKKNNRTTDTFVSVDIPAHSSGDQSLPSDSANKRQINKTGRKMDLEPPLEEQEDESTQGEGTINTREQNLSVQSSIGGRMTNDGDTDTEFGSAGVDPSIGGNVSPTSTITIPDSKINTDLKNFIEQQEDEHEKIEEGNEPKSSERDNKFENQDKEQLESRDFHIPDGQDEVEQDNNNLEGGNTVPNEEPPKLETDETEITENGGDNDAFKALLAEELSRITQEESEITGENEDLSKDENKLDEKESENVVKEEEKGRENQEVKDGDEKQDVESDVKEYQTESEKRVETESETVEN